MRLFQPRVGVIAVCAVIFGVSLFAGRADAAFTNPCTQDASYAAFGCYYPSPWSTSITRHNPIRHRFDVSYKLLVRVHAREAGRAQYGSNYKEGSNQAFGPNPLRANSNGKHFFAQWSSKEHKQKVPYVIQVPILKWINGQQVVVGTRSVTKYRTETIPGETYHQDVWAKNGRLTAFGPLLYGPSPVA